MIFIISLSSVSCETKKTLTDENKIEKRIEAFQQEYNAGNFEEMMNHFDKKLRAKLKMTIGLMEGLLGHFTGIDFISFSDLFGIAVGMNEGDLIDFEIKEINIDKAKGKAIVKAVMIYGGKYSHLEEDCSIILVKEENTWLISDIQ